MRPIPGVRGTAADLMRERNFRFIWSVGILAEFGRRYEILVFSLLILDITNSPAQLMLLWVFNNLPRPFVSSIAGYIADRFPRQRIMLLTQAVNLATAGGLLALMLYGLDTLQTWHIFVAAFIQGTSKAIEDPSRRTGIFDIVGRERLVNAMSLDVISQNVGKMIGPVVCGLLIQFYGYSDAYIFLLVVHLATLWLISRLQIPEAGPRAAVPPLWSGLGNSFGFAWKTPMLVGMLSITLVMNALAFPLQQFIPAVGKDLLDVGPALVGAPGGSRRIRPSNRCVGDGVDKGRPVSRPIPRLWLDHCSVGVGGLRMVSVVRTGIRAAVCERPGAGRVFHHAEQHNDAGLATGHARSDDGAAQFLHRHSQSAGSPGNQLRGFGTVAAEHHLPPCAGGAGTAGTRDGADAPRPAAPGAAGAEPRNLRQLPIGIRGGIFFLARSQSEK